MPNSSLGYNEPGTPNKRLFSRSLVEDTLTKDVQGILVCDASGNVVGVTANRLDVDTELPAAAALSDSLANPTAPIVGAAGLLFTGSTWGREMGSIASNNVLSGAATGSRNSADQANVNHRGLIVFLDVTATPNNAETLQVVFQGKDTASGKYVDMAPFTALTASVLGATPATATFAYTIYPGASEAVAAANHEVQALPLPKQSRIRAVHSSTGSWTYSVTIHWVL